MQILCSIPLFAGESCVVLYIMINQRILFKLTYFTPVFFGSSGLQASKTEITLKSEEGRPACFFIAIQTDTDS